MVEKKNAERPELAAGRVRPSGGPDWHSNAQRRMSTYRSILFSYQRRASERIEREGGRSGRREELIRVVVPREKL